MADSAHWSLVTRVFGTILLASVSSCIHRISYGLCWGWTLAGTTLRIVNWASQFWMDSLVVGRDSRARGSSEAYGVNVVTVLTQEHRLNCCGAAWTPPWHMGSLPDRDQTCISRVGKAVLYHWVEPCMLILIMDAIFKIRFSKTRNSVLGRYHFIYT